MHDDPHHFSKDVHFVDWDFVAYIQNYFQLVQNVFYMFYFNMLSGLFQSLVIASCAVVSKIFRDVMHVDTIMLAEMVYYEACKSKDETCQTY